MSGCCVLEPVPYAVCETEVNAVVTPATRTTIVKDASIVLQKSLVLEGTALSCLQVGLVVDAVHTVEATSAISNVELELFVYLARGSVPTVANETFLFSVPAGIVAYGNGSAAYLTDIGPGSYIVRGVITNAATVTGTSISVNARLSVVATRQE